MLPDADAQLAALTRINADDLLDAFGLYRLSLGRTLLRQLVNRPAADFARKIQHFDLIVGRQGLRAGAAYAVALLASQVEIYGQERIPSHGPLLLVANHPGLADAVALCANIPRDDLLLIAAERPFLRALPHTSRHLLSVGAAPASRSALLRAATRHLRAGGALLTFPAGRIEPDPALRPDAATSLAEWSASIELFARLADNLAILPAIVSGVLSPSAQRSLLCYLRRRETDRRWLGAMLQLILPQRYPVTVQLRFGQPVCIQDYVGASAVRSAVLAEARRLVEAASAATMTPV